MTTTFIPRAAEMERLVEGLIDQRYFGPVAVSTALPGARGLGKTRLVREMVEDPRIQKAFPGGAVFTRLGRSLAPLELVSRIDRLAYDLTGHHPMLTDVPEASRLLTELLADHRVLLIVDDADDPMAVRPFLDACPDGGLLLISHYDSILPPGVTRIAVDICHTEEALDLLTCGLPGSEWTHSALFKNLAERLNEWPLLLVLVNGLLNGCLAENTASNPVDVAARAGVGVMDALSACGLQPYWTPGDPTVFRKVLNCLVTTCLESLPPEDRRRCCELAVFSPGEPIPAAAIRLLWSGGMDNTQADKLLDALVLRHLLDRAPLSGDYTLSQAIHACLASRLGEIELANLHGRLADAGQRALDGAASGYLYRWLSTHLARAGRMDALKALLFDFNWLSAALDSHRDLPGLLLDYEMALSTALDRQSGELRLAQETLRLSAPSLARGSDSLPTRLAEQLTGRLCCFDEPNLRALLDGAAASAPVSHAAKTGDAPSRAWLRPINACFTPPGDHELRVMRGHAGWVTSLALLPDGQHAFSGSLDGALMRWNLANGRCEVLWTPPDLAAVLPVRSLEALMAPGLAVPVTAPAGRVVDLPTHSPGAIAALSLAQDGSMVVTGDWNGVVHVHEAATGEELLHFPAHHDPIAAMILSPDGRTVYTASDDSQIKAWEVQTGRLRQTLFGHLGPVHALAITPDGRTLLSGSWDGMVRLWDLDNNTVLHTLEGHEGWVRAVAISPDGYYAVSSGWDHTLRIWDLFTAEAVHTLRVDMPILSLSITPDSRQVLAGDGAGRLRLWDLERGEEQLILAGHNGGVNALAITPSGRFAVSASDDTTLRVWDLAAAQHRGGASLPIVPVTTMVALPGPSDHAAGSQAALTLSEDGALRQWNPITGRVQATLDTHSASCLAVTPDGRHALTADRDGSLKLWDLPSGALVAALGEAGPGITALSITPAAHRAVTADRHGVLRLWDLKAGVLLAQFYTAEGAEYGAITSLALTPDGQHLIASHQDGRMLFLKLENESAAS